jgi:hypothetical protein
MPSNIIDHPLVLVKQQTWQDGRLQDDVRQIMDEAYQIANICMAYSPQEL